VRHSCATLSLDLDDLWSYLKVRGDPAWQEFPSYLEEFVPRLVRFLDELGLRITVFVVGADAARPGTERLLELLVKHGHELGNHSYSHDSWLRAYPAKRLAEEIDRTDEAIERAVGSRPLGFRGPGFSWNGDLLNLLAQRNYVYDASTFPTFLTPLARAYYFRTARVEQGERERRRMLFGSWRDGFLPLRPYRWQVNGGRTLLEIPVTTMPGLRTPFHLSYLVYLSRFSMTAMEWYMRAALASCRIASVPPSVLLHPTDLLDARGVPRLAFFPGMDLSAEHKETVLRRALSLLVDQFDVCPLGQFSHQLAGSSLAVRSAPDESASVEASFPTGHNSRRYVGNL
jgi:peptidoglycan-N-acetylglucosamine deacetylase